MPGNIFEDIVFAWAAISGNKQCRFDFVDGKISFEEFVHSLSDKVENPKAEFHVVKGTRVVLVTSGGISVPIILEPLTRRNGKTEDGRNCSYCNCFISIQEYKDLYNHPELKDFMENAYVIWMYSYDKSVYSGSCYLDNWVGHAHNYTCSGGTLSISKKKECLMLIRPMRRIFDYEGRSSTEEHIEYNISGLRSIFICPFEEGNPCYDHPEWGRGEDFLLEGEEKHSETNVSLVEV